MNWRSETEREDDGRWIVRVPELSGALALGANRARAVADVAALAWRVLVGRLEYGGNSD